MINDCTGYCGQDSAWRGRRIAAAAGNCSRILGWRFATPALAVRRRDPDEDRPLGEPRRRRRGCSAAAPTRRLATPKTGDEVFGYDLPEVAGAAALAQMPAVSMSASGRDRASRRRPEWTRTGLRESANARLDNSRRKIKLLAETLAGGLDSTPISSSQIP